MTLESYFLQHRQSLTNGLSLYSAFSFEHNLVFFETFFRCICPWVVYGFTVFVYSFDSRAFIRFPAVMFLKGNIVPDPVCRPSLSRGFHLLYFRLAL